jgi:hypothetical protein
MGTDQHGFLNAFSVKLREIRVTSYFSICVHAKRRCNSREPKSLPNKNLTSKFLLPDSLQNQDSFINDPQIHDLKVRKDLPKFFGGKKVMRESLFRATGGD